jgi:cytoskeletal protein CcmA (bactofilin family)
LAAPEQPADKPLRDEIVAPGKDGPGRAHASLSRIGYTVVMKGDLTVGEDLVIEGTFHGTITSDGHNSITVRRIASISGAVSADNLNVEDGTDLQRAILTGRIRLVDEKCR